MRVVVVVGDRFEAFAKNETVVCIGELENSLENGGLLEDEVFVLGQGVGADRIGHLLQLATIKGKRGRFFFEEVTKCGPAEVHKLKPENSILSLPVQLDVNTYEASVLLDDRSELFSDHVGGQHLPGMILIEVVRQMGLAVIEKFFSKNFPNGCSFLWSSIQMDFMHATFPVETTIICRILQRQIVKSRRESIRFGFEFLQQDLVVVSSLISVELHDRYAAERQERRLAAAASTMVASRGQDKKYG